VADWAKGWARLIADYFFVVIWSRVRSLPRPQRGHFEAGKSDLPNIIVEIRNLSQGKIVNCELINDKWLIYPD
jgi:hypothetical protein